jgi:hypothetical protein
VEDEAVEFAFPLKCEMGLFSPDATSFATTGCDSHFSLGSANAVTRPAIFVSPDGFYTAASNAKRSRIGTLETGGHSVA